MLAPGSPLLPPAHGLLCLSEAGEDIKRIEHAHALWSSLDEAGFDRNSAIIGLGGGTVTDLSAFVASTYLRGVDFWLIPTTLLAMVDAAAGGKTGINLGGAKNRIGTFAHPSGVSLCPEFLATLPERQLLSGMAEHVKHILLHSTVHSESSGLGRMTEALLALDGSIGPGLRRSHPRIGGHQRRASSFRMWTESTGIRKLLNLGHTAGHALESWAMSEGLDLLHGEAVAWGLGVELAISWSTRFGIGTRPAPDDTGRGHPAGHALPGHPARLRRLVAMGEDGQEERRRPVQMVLLSGDGSGEVDQSVSFDEFDAACRAVSPTGTAPA